MINTHLINLLKTSKLLKSLDFSISYQTVSGISTSYIICHTSLPTADQAARSSKTKQI